MTAKFPLLSDNVTVTKQHGLLVEQAEKVRLALSKMTISPRDRTLVIAELHAMEYRIAILRQAVQAATS